MNCLYPLYSYLADFDVVVSILHILICLLDIYPYNNI